MKVNPIIQSAQMIFTPGFDSLRFANEIETNMNIVNNIWLKFTRNKIPLKNRTHGCCVCTNGKTLFEFGLSSNWTNFFPSYRCYWINRRNPGYKQRLPGCYKTVLSFFFHFLLSSFKIADLEKMTHPSPQDFQDKVFVVVEIQKNIWKKYFIQQFERFFGISMSFCCPSHLISQNRKCIIPFLFSYSWTLDFTSINFPQWCKHIKRMYFFSIGFYSWWILTIWSFV